MPERIPYGVSRFHREVEHYPEGEKREVIDLYVERGLPEEDATAFVEILSRHKETWIDITMLEEFGIVESDESFNKNSGLIPLLVGGLTAAAAYIVGQLPAGLA